MEKVCVVGSSLITSLFIEEIKKHTHCIVYNLTPELGGAWACNQFNGIDSQIYNNIICPLNSEEELHIKRIYSKLY